MGLACVLIPAKTIYEVTHIVLGRDWRMRANDRVDASLCRTDNYHRVPEVTITFNYPGFEVAQALVTAASKSRLRQRSLTEQSSDGFHRQEQSARLLLQRDKAVVPIKGLSRIVFRVNHHGHSGDVSGSFQAPMQGIHE